MVDDHNMKKKVISSLIWAFLERCGAQGVGLVINIILARILAPDDYGILAIMVVFTSLANQFIQNGFATSLIQNPDVTEDDYSSVFHVSMGITWVLYGILWFTAPAIGTFYEIPDIVWPLRVLSLVLFLGTIQSVQTAKLRREMDFKNLFYTSLAASITGGIIGIVIAFMGGGIWALVAQQLLGTAGTCVALFFRFHWVPRLIIRWDRVVRLFSYGWKILAASLLNTLYTNLTGLIIGKKYTPTMLAYYDKGQMLPNKIISNLNDTIQTVMLSALSSEQQDLSICKKIMRRSVQVSCFLVLPMMAGLAAVAEPVVVLLLTEKWLPCVPFLKLTCLIYAAYPIITANLQAIKALGRSDVYLKLEVIKKILGLTILVSAVWFYDSVMAIMIGSVIEIYLSIFINAVPNTKIVSYTIKEQIYDILPPALLSLVMYFLVSGIGYIHFSIWITLGLQIFVGVIFYLSGARLFKIEGFMYTWNLLFPRIQKAFKR